MEVEVIPPHVEYRLVQMLEQEHEAWVCEREHDMMAAGRPRRLRFEVEQTLAQLSKAHEEDQDNALRDYMHNANQLGIAAAARLASVDSPSARHINQPHQAYNRSIAAVHSREQHTYFREV